MRLFRGEMARGDFCGDTLPRAGDAIERTPLGKLLENLKAHLDDTFIVRDPVLSLLSSFVCLNRLSFKGRIFVERTWHDAR